jgi:hypothetical protein
VKRERRKDLTAREWKAITSARPVIRLISQPKKKPKGRNKER